MKTTLRVLTLINSVLFSVVLMIPIHEAGHALACLACGGKVLAFSFVPQANHVASTTMLLPPSATFFSYLFVSSSGYLLVVLVALVLLVVGIRGRSIASNYVFFPAVTLLLAVGGQLVHTIVLLCRNWNQAFATDMDIWSLVAQNPGKSHYGLFAAGAMLFIVMCALVFAAVFAKGKIEQLVWERRLAS